MYCDFDFIENSDKLAYKQYRGWGYYVELSEDGYAWYLKSSCLDDNNSIDRGYDTHEYASTAAEYYIDSLIIEQYEDSDTLF